MCEYWVIYCIKIMTGTFYLILLKRLTDDFYPPFYYSILYYNFLYSLIGEAKSMIIWYLLKFMLISIIVYKGNSWSKRKWKNIVFSIKKPKCVYEVSHIINMLYHNVKQEYKLVNFKILPKNKQFIIIYECEKYSKRPLIISIVLYNQK